ncbi:hypothetical protein [Actinomycetospora flava]|uniref:Basic proline-rich protein n=1 Tax=Actinomycetospora flava TaxID=3129232 RepID=A0ABU8LX24_9PSEU
MMSPAAPAQPALLLTSLRDLPGFAHALLTDTDPDGHDRRVVAEVGTDEGTAAAVLGWGRRAAGVAGDRDLALDDVIVTTDTAHHLLRAVGTPITGWIYLRVRRDGGNLALARRRLAALTAPQAPAAGRAPAPAGPPELPAGPSSTPSATPPLAARSTPWPDRVPPPTRPPAATPTGAGPATVTAATTPGAPAALPAPPGPAPSRPRDEAPAPAPAPPPRSVPATPWAPPPARVAARGPSRTAAASAPPPAREIPDIAPELPWPRRPPAASALPAVPAPRPDPASDTGPDGDPGAPKDSAGVLGQRWRSDPETLRRVLAGLLRLGRAPQTALAGPESTTTRSPGATPTRRNP